MSRVLLTLLITSVWGSLSYGQPQDPDSVREAPRVLNPNAVGVGQLVTNAKWTTIDGRDVELQKLLGPNGLVIAFTNTTCPLCKKYGASWTQLEQTLTAKGFGVVYINPTSNEKLEAMKAFVKNHQLQGAYIHDQSGSFARQLGAATTTEVFLLDKQRTIVYRGAVDDQYGLGYSLNAPKANYLLSAASALLAQRRADPAATTAPGCELDLSHTKPTPTVVTYHNRISRIIQTHCIECHRTGGVGPFKLETYADVVAQAGMIRKVVEKGTMPPWFAVPNPGEAASHWANDRSVPQADKDDLFAWLKSDRPLGEESDAPMPRNFDGGWLIGKPDAVYEFAQPVKVKAKGTMPYQNIVVDTKLTEDKWVKAIEVRPSAPDVVHHVLVFAIPPDSTGQVEDERMGFFAAYVPGHSSFSYPDGFAKKLPKGTRLRFQMHYTPNGTATQDQTRLGVVFADVEPKYEIHVVGIANARIAIPAGADNHPEIASLKVPGEATLLAFMPHMHLRGKAFRYEISTPEGELRTLLNIPQYDFNWQLYYRLAEPLPLTAGTVLKATAWYDNSSKNPANPDPKKDVYWGPQTFDEMMLGYIEYYLPVGTTVSMYQPRQSVDARLLYLKIDKNLDGKISKAEFEAFLKSLPRFQGNPEQIEELIKRVDANNDGVITLEELRKLPGVK